MKINIDTTLAVELLKQIGPEYDQLYGQLVSDPELAPNITKFSRHMGLDGYPLLYIDNQNILKLLLLSVMPANQINDLNEYVAALSVDDLSTFSNQTIKNLVESPEKLGEILDASIPSSFDFNDSSTHDAQTKVIFTAFLVQFHDIVSFLVHGKRITDLVQSAINGDDDALCLAVQTDRLTLEIPYFKARINKALLLSTDEDVKFLYNFGYRLQNPLLRGSIKNRRVWISLLLLDNLGMLDGSLTRAEILQILDDAKVEGISSEDSLSRMLRTFRAYQNSPSESK